VQGDYLLDARYDWWGCNAGSGPLCASFIQNAGSGISRYPWLTLTLDVDSQRIETVPGGTTKFRATPAA
jgi:hypothetical protein